MLVIALLLATGTMAMPDMRQETGSAAGNKADLLVYTNGIIYTVDPQDQDWHRQNQHSKQALVVAHGKIALVGSNAEAESMAKQLDPSQASTSTLDLEGATVLPGIHDVHMHPLEAFAEYAGTCELQPDWDIDEEEVKNTLKECYKHQIGTDWLLGSGHSIEKVLEHLSAGGRDPKSILDECVPSEVPVLLMETTSHSFWANSEALRRAGVNASSLLAPAGIAMKNKNGEPNGILLENTGNTLMDQATDPAVYKDLSEMNYEALLQSLSEMASFGITSVCDARCFWRRQHHAAWERALDEGKLTVRAVLGLWASPEKDDAEQLEALAGLFSNDGQSLLRKSQVKMYSDGLLGSTTAAMLHKYNVDLGILPENKGMNYFDEARMSKYLSTLQKVGFDFHIHAIGDRGVREALNAVETAAAAGDGGGHRHRLTHLEIVSAEDLPRFAKLGVTADVQLSGDFVLPTSEEFAVTQELVGVNRSADFIPAQSLVAAGARLTLSSDFDVSGMNPFVGMQHAVSRGTQSIDLKTALEAYTINGAYVMRQEDSTGSLTVGKQADLIVIDSDIFQAPVEKIGQTRVLQTLLAGKEVFRSSDF